MALNSASRHLIHLSLLSLLASLVASACGFPIGDQTHDVTVRNREDVAVVVYSYGRDPRYKDAIGPGQSTKQSWMYPITPDDRRVRRVEADNAQGTLVFCRDISFADLQRTNWTVDVAVGYEACPVPR